MIDANARTRVRWLWLLTAATAAYAIGNVLAFYLTDSFGPAWFAAGLIVYGLVFVTGVALAIIDPATTEPAAEGVAVVPEETEANLQEMSVLDRETLYRTRTGHLLRVRFATDEGERSLLFTVTQDEVLPVTAIEDRLDEVDFEPPAVEDQREIEDALARRASHRRDSEAETVPVELLDHEILYETPTGRLVEATYRASGDQLSGLFVVSEGQVTPIRDVEAHLDRLQTDQLPIETEAEFERVLEAHRANGAGSDPEQVIQG